MYLCVQARSHSLEMGTVSRMEAIAPRPLCWACSFRQGSDSPPCWARAKTKAEWTYAGAGLWRVLKMLSLWVFDQRDHMPISSHWVWEGRWPLPASSTSTQLTDMVHSVGCPGFQWHISSAHRTTVFPQVHFGSCLFQKWVTILECMCVWAHECVCVHGCVLCVCVCAWVYMCARVCTLCVCVPEHVCVHKVMFALRC